MKGNNNSYLKDRLYAQQKGICAYCKKPVLLAAFNVDHVVPLSRGGADSRTNKIGSCVECNQKKGSKKCWTPVYEVDGKKSFTPPHALASPIDAVKGRKRRHLRRKIKYDLCPSSMN